MFAVPDALSAFFLVCFFIGLVYVLVSAFLGFGHDLADGLDTGAHGGDFGHADGGHGDFGDSGDQGADVSGHGGDLGHFGGDGHEFAHAGDSGHEVVHAGVDHAHSSAASASPLNLMTIMAFLTWFGAAGYILYVPFGQQLLVALLGGVAAGLIGGWIVYTFLVKVLLRGSTIAAGPEYRVIGKVAEVTLQIEPGHVGEVVYTIAGTRHSDGARSATGQPIPRGTEVGIVGFEKGVAIVEPLQTLLEDVDSNKGARD